MPANQRYNSINQMLIQGSPQSFLAEEHTTCACTAPHHLPATFSCTPAQHPHSAHIVRLHMLILPISCMAWFTNWSHLSARPLSEAPAAAAAGRGPSTADTYSSSASSASSASSCTRIDDEARGQGRRKEQCQPCGFVHEPARPAAACRLAPLSTRRHAGRGGRRPDARQ